MRVTNHLRGRILFCASRLRVPAILAPAFIVACSSDDGSSTEGEGGGGGNSSGGAVFFAGSGGTSGSGGSSGTTSSGGTAGMTGTGATTSSTGGAAGACLNLYARCDDNPAGCCAGTACAQSGGIKVCQSTCQEASDCGSMCCVFDDAAGANMCKAPEACCVNEGEFCDNRNAVCCGDHLVCASYQDPSLNACRPRCTMPTDCTSGCCVLFGGETFGFCADASQCQ